MCPSRPEDGPAGTAPLADAFGEFVASTADAVVVYEQDGFSACNDAAVRLFGLAHADELLALHPSDVSPASQPDGANSFERANELIAIALERGSHRFEWTHAKANTRSPQSSNG